MSIISHIEYLLQTHDCIVIPGLGAILAHGMAAVYDEATAEWFPPVRVFSFNPELTRTDGLIAESVARRESISVSAATAKVKAESDSLRRSLIEERKLSLGAVGQIQLNEDNKMIFVPGNVSWLSPSLMWLPVLTAKEEAAENSTISRRLAADIRRRRRGEMIRRACNLAACVAVILILGWIVMTNMGVLPEVQYASVIPVWNDEQHAENHAAEIEPVYEVAEEPIKVILAMEPNEIMENEERPITQEISGARYHLIVASLNSEEDAMRFIAQYKDLKLGILRSGEHYRVYAAKGDSWQDVAYSAYLPGIYENFSSAWVCTQ